VFAEDPDDVSLEEITNVFRLLKQHFSSLPKN
jgi:hypothetical protein